MGQTPLRTGLRLVGGCQDVLVLVLVHGNQSDAGRAEVLARVEIARFVIEMLADRRGHPKAAVGIDVHFAHSRLGGLAQLLFRNADGILEVPAVVVDHLDGFDRHGR